MPKTLTIKPEQLPTKKSESWRNTDVSSLAATYRVAGKGSLEITSPREGVTIERLPAPRAVKKTAQKVASADTFFERLVAVAPVTRINVKSGHQCMTPIVLRQQSSELDALTRSQVELVLQKNASARLVEKSNDAPASGLNLFRLSIKLEEGAQLEHRVEDVQPKGTNQKTQIYMRRVTVAQDARYSIALTTSAPQLARHDLAIQLNGPRAQALVTGTYTAHDTNLIDHHVSITHAAPHTTSSQNLNGIIADQAKGVFNGVITVQRSAPHSQATQLNKTLLIGPKAQMFTKPELHIDTDKVTCSHGASIGRLDDSALFYLTSRGLPKPEAQQHLMRAFLLSAMPTDTHPLVEQQLT